MRQDKASRSFTRTYLVRWADHHDGQITSFFNKVTQRGPGAIVIRRFRCFCARSKSGSRGGAAASSSAAASDSDASEPGGLSGSVAGAAAGAGAGASSPTGFAILVSRSAARSKPRFAARSYLRGRRPVSRTRRSKPNSDHRLPRRAAPPDRRVVRRLVRRRRQQQRLVEPAQVEGRAVAALVGGLGVVVLRPGRVRLEVALRLLVHVPQGGLGAPVLPPRGLLEQEARGPPVRPLPEEAVVEHAP